MSSSTVPRAWWRSRALTTASAICVWASCYGIGWAQNGQEDPTSAASLKRLSLEELGAIEVTTASKGPETIRRTPAAIAVLTSEDIQRSGATSLPELLRLVPGVQVSRIDSDHWAVGVRGLASQFSQSLLVLIDGRSLYNPLFAGVFWFAQDTLLEDIDRIEVIRGPGGTIWGANAVNGVINIITKRARDTRGLLASIGGGSLDHVIAGARYGGGRRDEEFDYRVYGKAFDRGAGFHSDDLAYDTWSMQQAGARADWVHQRDHLTLQGDVYHGRDGQRITYGSFSPPSQITSYDPYRIAGGNLVADWRRDLVGGGDLQLQAYYDRTFRDSPQLVETRNTFDVDFVHRRTYARRHQVTWGLGARLSPNEIVPNVATLNVLPNEETNSVYSAFGQDEIAVLDTRIWLTVGGKLEHNNYTGAEVQPSVRLLWTPTSSQSVWGGVTRAVRTPSRLEEGFDYTAFLLASPLAYLRLVGNRDFQSERVIGYEAGYRTMVTPRFYVDLAAFHNDHDRLTSLGRLTTSIETSPAPPHFLLTIPYANGVRGTSDGIEIAPDWQPSSAWQLRGSYSYLNIDMRNAPDNTDTSTVTTYEGSSPRHQAVLRSSITPGRGWQFDQTLRYSSALPAQNVAAYVALDLRVGRALNRSLMLAVAGHSLTSHHHAEFAHSTPPVVDVPRSVYATVTWTR